MVATTELTKYLSLGDVAKLAPGRPSTKAVWRWLRIGIKSRASGEFVRLRHVRIGRSVYTTAPWLDEFWQAVAASDLGRWDKPKQQAIAPLSSARRAEREHLAASRRLAKAGL